MENLELNRARIRLALYWTAALTAAFVAADLILGAPPAALLIKAGGLVATGLGLLILKRIRTLRSLILLAQGGAGSMLALMAAAAVNARDLSSVQVLAPVVCVGAAALLPWGWRLQAAVVAAALAAVAASLYFVGGPFHTGTLAVIFGCVLSLPMAAELTRRSSIAAMAQREEQAATTRLARAGDELELQSDHPEGLLRRGCRLAVEVLQADTSRVFMIEGDDLVQMAAYANRDVPAGVCEATRASRKSVQSLLERLEREGAVCLTMADAAEFRAAPPQLKHEIAMATYFPLRRQGKIIGVQSAEYRRREERARDMHLCLARSLSHLMSLAIENARLARNLQVGEQVNDDFLANVSHELRTPLNVIIGYNDLLLEGAFDPLSSEQKRTLERVQHSARELLELLSITLELSRGASRRQQPLEHEVRLEALVDELIEEMRALPLKPGVRLQWNPPATALPTVWTDRRHLKMILKNLLENAIKFTDRGRVAVEARAADGGVVVRIRDTGAGIAPQEAERIFEPFQRGERASVQGRSGVGLGLYIVKRLLEGLQGKIEMESVPGQGATFSVWIPQRRSPAEAAPLESLAQAG